MLLVLRFSFSASSVAEWKNQKSILVVNKHQNTDLLKILSREGRIGMSGVNLFCCFAYLLVLLLRILCCLYSSEKQELEY